MTTNTSPIPSGHLALGVDVGGTKAKYVLIDVANCQVRLQKAIPTFCAMPLDDWPSYIQTDDSLQDVGPIAIAIAASHVAGGVQKTSKFPKLEGQAVSDIEAQLTKVLSRPVRIIHDGTAGHLAALHEDPIRPSSSAFLAFGTSIGLSLCLNGGFITLPYNCWVSHTQIAPTFAFDERTCELCNQRGCARSVYKHYIASKDAAGLAQTMAQLTINLLNTVPLDCVYLGGGVLASYQLYQQVVQRVKPCVLLDANCTLRPVPKEEIAGAYGAALFAAGY